MSNAIRFFTMEQFHAKRGIGSTRIRVHNLIKYWPEAELYQYGEKPDVMIYQKVYATYDYTLPLRFPAIRILDVCDPDFKDTPDIHFVDTLNAMDAIVVPTETYKTFISRMTDTPVYVIKDRFDLSEFPQPKVHTGDAKTVSWFGYSHNAGTLKLAMPSIERRNLDLLVVSDSDPQPYKMCIDAAGYLANNYTYKKFIHPLEYKQLQQSDICVLPPGNRPMDVFKSENKTIIANLLGLPVATTADELDALLDPKARQDWLDNNYANIKAEYDCVQSVKEYKELINDIANNRN